MIKLASKLVLLCIISLALKVPAAAKKQVYFGCEAGFLYESKKDAAHCIKQEKFIYQPPIACKMSRNTNLQYKLVIDKIGQNDQCVLQSLAVKSNQLFRNKNIKNTAQNSYNLKCSPGYLLAVRKGKDACTKVRAEVIKPPNKKIRR
jgi:hypothetical protein